MYALDEHRFYRKARRKFSVKTYGLLFLWLLLALIQWLVIVLIEDARETFRSLYYICLVTFALAILLFAIFIFVEDLRFVTCLNFLVALIIVELQIISTFILVALSWWADVLTFFAVALILVVLFLLIGVFLPAKMDLTLDIAIIFIIAFLFLIIASFILLFEFLVGQTSPYAYLVVELSVTLTILTTNYRPITADSWMETSTPSPVSNETRVLYRNLGINSDWVTSFSQTTRPSSEDDPWLTTSFDYDDNADGDDYPQIPKGRGKEVPRGGHGHRDPNEIDPIDRRRPNNRDSTIDWSVYHRRPSYRGGNRERARSNVPKANRKPDDWDPEYITQGIDGEVPFDDADAREFGKSVGSNDIVHQTTNEDHAGPWLEFGAAEGKLAVGLGNPPIDFPSAEHQPNDGPTVKKMPKSDDTSNIYIIPKAPPLDRNRGHLTDTDSRSDIRNGDQEVVTVYPSPNDNMQNIYVLPGSKVFLESDIKIREPKLLGDEMKGFTKQQFSEGLPDVNMEYTPQWEELSEDEIRKLSGQQITGRWIEPLVTREPYKPISHPDNEKLVMNDSINVLI
ncbi:uncharacterized protein LOC108136026 isoform X2 [Drosophila elegans]|uniref:uncharacterized protein LOC108136026 isoform X2 n=1 Tax=Drosophila elegans TaxID=30023 RepID=UPI0007E62E73|nr:uncharacterized protein LOC108136026 isoform X2 [Drosophila elegans]